MFTFFKSKVQDGHTPPKWQSGTQSRFLNDCIYQKRTIKNDLTNTKYSFTRPLIFFVKIDMNKGKFINKTMSPSTNTGVQKGVQSSIQ